MMIDSLIDALIEREGGYADHPDDRGGPTNWGITVAVARANGYHGAMRAMPRETAAAIYRRKYWIKPRFSEIANHAPTLAAEMFDIGVNMGPAIASGFLQRLLNALNRGGRDFHELEIDNRIGPATLSALSKFLKLRGRKAEAVLTRALDSLQAERYLRLAESRPANETFLYGWLANRTGA
ncbi:MAG: glycosyl hydrolase 108 family protein [Blastomonas sp.]